MDRRPFGPTGASVVRIGLGTWQMEGDDRKSCVSALRAGLDAGMAHIDTAELYGSGNVEEIVAEAIEGRRDALYLVSKVMPNNASKKGTLAACEKSLRRLRTDRLDCYLLHWAGSHPLEETIAAFEALREAGKIRAWGVSNFDEDELEHALAIAGPGTIACNQVLYHLAERAIEHAVVPFCEKHGIAVVGYTPFGVRAFPPGGASGTKVLDGIAQKHSATARQVALAFLTRRPFLFGIPKSAQAAHARDNAAAGSLTLDAADEAAIDAAFPLGRRRQGVPTL
ncbi:MAG TPA: aldo/keto reductase [Polyangiaceae bacterium]|nr:aldo/keto reductase [Polyangiaceae bacterium]